MGISGCVAVKALDASGSRQRLDSACSQTIVLRTWAVCSDQADDASVIIECQRQAFVALSQANLVMDLLHLLLGQWPRIAVHVAFQWK